MTHTPIAIIGAGVAGLAAARQLPPTSYVVFEKSRGPGGRLASKRINGLRADIGAQFFTVRDPRFEETIALASDAGSVRRWSPRMGAFRNGRLVSSPDKQERYVGFPYMNSLAHFLSQSVDVWREARISSVIRDRDTFVLTSTAGEIYTAEQVLVTAPVDQMRELLADFETDQIASKFAMDPTWTTVVSSDDQLTAVDGEIIDACFGGDHEMFDFITVERSKPGRDSNLIVIHSSPDWAKAHLEDDPECVSSTMSSMLHEALEIQSSPLVSHRWRYARPADPTVTTQKGVYQVDSGLWIAGDYLAGGRVEGSFLAGIEAADRLKGN